MDAHAANPVDEGAIKRAVERLRAGQLVAFPTETVYGLGADALNRAAVERVFAIKGRPSFNPLIVHVASTNMVHSLAREWPSEAETLARAFWPGPLTIIVPKAQQVPGEVSGGGDTVALRQPAHPVAQALLEAFGGPLVGPSANRSGHVSPTTAAHVRAEFGDEVLVLDGGPCTVGVESTVVMLDASTFRNWTPRILRPGAIGARQIASALGVTAAAVSMGPHRDAQVEPGETASAPRPLSGPMVSPGLLKSHYAPRTRAILLRRRADAPPGALVVRLPRDPRTCATTLYKTLREADDHALARGITTIAIVPPRAVFSNNRSPYWAAIRDRLRRATAPRD